jgi:hypothetical protein
MAAEPHTRSIYHMTEIMQTKVKSSLMEVNSKMLDMGEVFKPQLPFLVTTTTNLYTHVLCLSGNFF